MLAADIPDKFPIPFAASAGAGFTRPVPEASQIGIQNGAASLTDGFPPDTFLPIGAGGTPPWGADFNGLLNQVTAWLQWTAAGGTVTYDAGFSTSIGGYPAGALLRSATLPIFWLSTADNNTTDPDDAAATGWTPLGGGGPARTIAVGGAVTLRPTDLSLGFARAASSSVLLQAAPTNGREFWFEDLSGNFATFPVVVSANTGHTIAGLPSFTCNVNRQCARFKFYSAANAWSVKI